MRRSSEGEVMSQHDGRMRHVPLPDDGDVSDGESHEFRRRRKIVKKSMGKGNEGEKLSPLR
jgi:hypothetical protein